MSCPSGKKGYPNGAAAAREARRIRRKARATKELRPYHCPDCAQYHLANGPPRRNFLHDEKRRRAREAGDAR